MTQNPRFCSHVTRSKNCNRTCLMKTKIWYGAIWYATCTFSTQRPWCHHFQTKRHQFPARIGSGWHTSNETLKAVNHDHIGHVIVTSCYQYDFGSFLIFYRFLDTKSQLSRSRDMSAPSYFYTNILWLNQNFWYSSRDVSPATPGTLAITYSL